MEDNYKHSDRILFVYSDTTTEWERFYNILGNSDYDLQKHKLSNISSIPKLTTDLIVICLTSDDENTAETLSDLRKQFIAPSTPCILITPSTENNIVQDGLNHFPEIKYFDLQVEVSKFLVATSILLRLRKMRSEHVQSQVEVVSENANLRDLNNRFNKDIQEAREIHQRLLPEKLPVFKSINCASYYLPLELVGGDLFDMWKIDEDKIGVFLGDITGHGLPAAFIAAMTKMCTALAPNSSPGSILTFLNSVLSNYLPDGRFITAVCCFIDTKGKVLTYSSAGHPPPLHFKSGSKKVESLNERGIPINIDPSFDFSDTKIEIGQGDKIIFYSDGLYETVNMSNQMMGIDTLTEKFEQFSKNESIDDVLHHLAKYQEDFSSGRLYKDDVTILGVEVVC